MKVKAYVLIVSTALLGMSAGSRKATPTVGANPGDIAPGIELTGNGGNDGFRNQPGCYTLLNFWAAYDAESRVRNVRLAHEIDKMETSSITLRSISLDENESIFTETVRMDGLDRSSQFHDRRGKSSDLYKKYDLKKGLRNFLIDDKGMIVATNITPEQLTGKLHAAR